MTYDRVNDLRSDFAADMLRILQSKLTVMGVDVLNVKITDVALPQELQARLESTTSFGTRIAEQEKITVGNEDLNEFIYRESVRSRQSAENSARSERKP